MARFIILFYYYFVLLVNEEEKDLILEELVTPSNKGFDFIALLFTCVTFSS